ncbi:MAG: DUF4056 domain-containing protein [Nanoarchaeota archaeon]|nr:DUF4056 domain-containing protein [Nanoarchaeota archaeon]
MKDLKRVLMVVFVIAGLSFISGTANAGVEWGHTPHGHFANNATNLNAFGLPAFDGNYIIYTAKAGIIDPDHVWGSGRKTFAAYKSAYSALMDGKSEFTSNGIKARNITYPSGWASMSDEQKKSIAQELALKLGKTIGFHCEIYHELQTFWGGGIDYESSFSCEDLYSDALGAELAMQAQKMENEGNGKATSNITPLANQFMKDNGAVSAKRAKEVSDSLKGTFWRSRMIQKAHMVRHLDIGVDGFVDNTAIPNFTPDRMSMTRLEAPLMDYSNVDGFSMELVVSSGKQLGKAKKRLDVKEIRILDHPRLMQIVKQDCIKKKYTVVD